MATDLFHSTFVSFNTLLGGHTGPKGIKKTSNATFKGAYACGTFTSARRKNGNGVTKSQGSVHKLRRLKFEFFRPNSYLIEVMC